MHGEVELGIYLYISMGTIMSMMLLFTRSSKIRSPNEGSHDIIFKSQKSLFWSVYTETTFKLKWGLQHFQKSQFSTLKTPE